MNSNLATPISRRSQVHLSTYVDYLLKIQYSLELCAALEVLQ